MNLTMTMTHRPTRRMWMNAGLLSVGLSLTGAARASVLLNADFEEGHTGWTFSAGSGTASLSTEAAYSGNSSALLSGADSSLSQSFDAVAVSSITELSLYAYSLAGALDLVVFTYADGSSSQSGVMGLGDEGWTLYDLTADLSAGQALVGLTIYGADAQFNYNDHITLSTSVSSVPEASSHGMMLAGLAAIGLVSRLRDRRRHQA